MAAVIAPLGEPRLAPNGILLLPERPRRIGPVSLRLLARWVVLYALMGITGTLLVTLSNSPRARAGGLSLIFPGGGFLYIASVELFVLTMAVFALWVVLWWGAGVFWALALVWLMPGLVAILMADGGRIFTSMGETWAATIGLVYGLAALSGATAVFRIERKFRRKRAKIPEINAYLASAVPIERKVIAEEPTDFDAELLRWLYDLALQPMDQFKGFDWGEQIHGPTCVRYQLNMNGYGLALYAANYLPNCPQPVESALASLIERVTDLRIWSYWRTLNLLGNFDANPDPLVRDNIMMSAYLLEQINLYEAATGGKRFDEPGSLTFVWKDGRSFPYDHHTIAETVQRNYQKHDFGFFPCEPGWMFTQCNTFGAQGLKSCDTLHGTARWPTVEKAWRRALEHEMLTPDGNLPHIRSKIIGLSFDTGEVPGGEYYVIGTNGFVDIAPDIAARSNLLALRGVPERMADLRSKIVDGELDIEVPAAPERNTLITTAVPGWTRIVAGARAVGELDVARAALRRMERVCGTGKHWPERPLHVGAQNMGSHLVVRWALPLNPAALSLRGYEAPRGPVLRSGPWDRVLVSLARSADGVSLDFAVGPRTTPAGIVKLEFDSLQPNREYRLSATGYVHKFTAGGDGRAAVDLVVDSLVRARLEPVGGSGGWETMR